MSTEADLDLLKTEDTYCSHGDTVHYNTPPKIFERAKGSFVYDTAGTRYLDLQMWYSACNFGYGNDQINTALKEQMDTLPQLASQFLHKEKAQLAERICLETEKRFGKKGRVHFNVGGAQAVEDALKLLRNHTKKNLAFAFMGGYHGRTLGASAITSSFRYRRRYGHFSERAHFVPFPYCFRCPYDMKRESCDTYCAKQFGKLFETEYNSFLDMKVNESEFPFFFIEPIQGTGGYVIPPRDYFQKLKAVMDKHNILLVSDEIQMGFYRTGKLWSIEHFGVTPDVIVFGKSLTNGMNPLSGLWAREDLISPDQFPPGSTHSTFSSNPLGTRAGLEVMNMLATSDHETLVMAKGETFLAALRGLQSQYPNIADVDGLGLALRVEICERDGRTPSKTLTDKIVERGLSGQLKYAGERVGLILDVGGYYKNVLTLAPSLYIDEKEMAMGIELLDQIFADVF